MKAYTKQRLVEVTEVTEDNAAIMVETLNGLFGEGSYTAANLVGCYVVLDGGCVKVMSRDMFLAEYDTKADARRIRGTTDHNPTSDNANKGRNHEGTHSVYGAFNPAGMVMGGGMLGGMSDGLLLGFPQHGFVPRFIGFKKLDPKAWGVEDSDDQSEDDTDKCEGCTCEGDCDHCHTSFDELDSDGGDGDEDSEDSDEDGDSPDDTDDEDEYPVYSPFGYPGFGLGMGPFNPLAPTSPFSLFNPSPMGVSPFSSPFFGWSHLGYPSPTPRRWGRYIITPVRSRGKTGKRRG